MDDMPKDKSLKRKPRSYFLMRGFFIFILNISLSLAFALDLKEIAAVFLSFSITNNGALLVIVFLQNLVLLFLSMDIPPKSNEIFLKGMRAHIFLGLFSLLFFILKSKSLNL
ncbi:hypothetical protein [Candidatus Leptofilum sp.]|uniref:hypothetical protein n=1 Tax=Candidatus Leptofilum sp. TaxID=3241576 RepID=UPI003B59D852